MALLAGISADYYLRLEQGRGGRPSDQVLRALARTLKLDVTATDHLLELASPGSAAAAPTGEPERAATSLLNLLAVLDLPGFVVGRTFDVLAANAAARALSPELVPGRNRLRSVFLVRAERELYQDWEATTRRFVAVVRETLGRSASDAGFVELIHELTARSPRFADLWTQHDVVARDAEVAAFRHPVVGLMRLHLERLHVAGIPGQSLVVYHPEAGSEDEGRLAALMRGAADAGGHG